MYLVSKKSSNFINLNFSLEMSEGAPVLTQDGTGIGGRGSIRASQYNVNVTGGNASVGNNSLMIVGTGTPR